MSIITKIINIAKKLRVVYFFFFFLSMVMSGFLGWTGLSVVLLYIALFIVIGYSLKFGRAMIKKRRSKS